MSKIAHLLCASLLVLAACDGQGTPAFDGGGGAGESTLQGGLAPTGWVTDAADILTAGEEERITKQLRQLERETGRQLVVVTVSTLEGQPIEEYTIALARRWGVGRRRDGDGVVVLVAPNERMVRIEVGTGLEHVVTNSFASSVIETAMLPRFREGDYGAGVSAGIKKLISRLSAR